MNKNIFLLIAAFSALISCEGTDFDDPSTLTNEEAVSKIRSFSYSLVTSSVQTAFNTTTSTAGVHFSLLADQTTNTNGNSNWWYYAQEPRMRIINSSSERSYNASLNVLYSNFYQANLDATKVIDIIENQGGKAFDDSGKDRTNDCSCHRNPRRINQSGNTGQVFIILKMDFHGIKDDLSLFTEVIRADGVNDDIVEGIKTYKSEKRINHICDKADYIITKRAVNLCRLMVLDQFPLTGIYCLFSHA